MTFEKIGPKTYSNGKGLKIIFSRAVREYVEFIHEPSNDRLNKAIQRSDDYGKMIFTVKDALAIGDKISELTDWSKSSSEVISACMADNQAIYKEMKKILMSLVKTC